MPDFFANIQQYIPDIPMKLSDLTALIPAARGAPPAGRGGGCPAPHPVAVLPVQDFTVTRLAGLSGAIAIGLGAYGSHVIRDSKIDERRKLAFETGARYHLIHSVALLAAQRARYPFLTSSIFLAGILFFSGTCYHYSITGDEKLRRFAPIGGVLFILGWLSFIF